jgi:phage gp46-like protein
MRLVWDPERGYFDLALTPQGGIDSGIGNGGLLESAGWVSLFTDARADLADMTPDLGDDQRGFWADSGKARPDVMGSLIWLYMREKRTETARLKLETTALDSLQWMPDDGLGTDLAVQVELLDAPRDAWRLTWGLTEPNGVRREWKVDPLWAGIAG